VLGAVVASRGRPAFMWPCWSNLEEIFNCTKGEAQIDSRRWGHKETTAAVRSCRSTRSAVMNDHEPTSPPETVPGSQRRVRQLLSTRRSRWISAVALMCAAAGISLGFAASNSTTTASNSTTTATLVPGSSAAGAGSGGGASNARSGPAAGGADGVVTSASKSSFTLTTSAGHS
jgi:hypothetical protein